MITSFKGIGTTPAPSPPWPRTAAAGFIGTIWPVAKGYTVFCVEQIDGLPEHFYARPSPPLPAPLRIEAADRFFAATGADIRHGGARAFYAEGPDYVQMPPFESFYDAESHAATLAHELTHWTKHGKRLAREFGRQRWGDAGYAAEELVASLGRLSSVPISRSRPSRAPITPATSRHGWRF